MRLVTTVSAARPARGKRTVLRQVIKVMLSSQLGIDYRVKSVIGNWRAVLETISPKPKQKQQEGVAETNLGPLRKQRDVTETNCPNREIKGGERIRVPSPHWG